jgi:hypothetical protein
VTRTDFRKTFYVVVVVVVVVDDDDDKSFGYAAVSR